MWTSHYTWRSVTTLHDFGGALGQPLDTSFWALTILMVTALGRCVKWPLQESTVFNPRFWIPDKFFLRKENKTKRKQTFCARWKPIQGLGTELKSVIVGVSGTPLKRGLIQQSSRIHFWVESVEYCLFHCWDLVSQSAAIESPAATSHGFHLNVWWVTPLNKWTYAMKGLRDAPPNHWRQRCMIQVAKEKKKYQNNIGIYIMNLWFVSTNTY
jgi:hypothetical protein